MPSPLDPASPNFTIFAYIITGLVLTIAIMMIGYMNNVVKTPAQPQGWNTLNYDALKVSRKSLSDYLTLQKKDMTIPLHTLQIATANFGGIFTENAGVLSPYTGLVSADAARLQVEAGARCIILDIWPDPAAPANPIVAAMMDTQESWIQNWWARTGGLGAGVGRYSNWQRMTRNSTPVADILGAAINAAFDTGSPQKADPFFVVLKLHGAMSIPYLNTLGTIVQSALAGHGMESATWGNANNQKALATEPVSSFASRAFVIVVPDIQTSYNVLPPNVRDYATFIKQLQTTTLGTYTNAIEQSANTIFFDPTNISAITPDMAGAGLLIVQPSIGGPATDNADLFSNTSYSACQATGAQMVAVNLFSQDPNDATLQSFFNTNLFGTYSFILSP
jgi:hypothetical protein